MTLRRADGFVVKERKGGASSGTFSWRVVAKRKDNPGKRLAKFDLPKIQHPGRGEAADTAQRAPGAGEEAVASLAPRYWTALERHRGGGNFVL